MQHGKRGPTRPVDGIDVAASVLARVAPRRLERAIDQLRLDARSVVDGLRGVREPTYSTPSRPPIAPLALRDIDPVLELLPRSLRRTYSTMRRDLQMIARDLRGDRVPPTIARPRRAEPPAPLPGITPRKVRVAAIIRETRDATTLRLEPLDGAPIAFEAGQFLTLHLVIDGAVVKRAYSLSSSPRDGRAQVTCKRIEGGRASTFVNERLREGDVIEVLGPSGTFVPRPATSPRHLVLVAGGSGITPCWSIARTLIAREPATRVTLLYGNRSEADVIFGDAIDALALAHPDRFHVVHVLSDPTGVRSGPLGLLDGAAFESIARERDLERDAPEYFVCGPAKMMDAIRAALLEMGAPSARIHEERFQTPGTARAKIASAPQLVTIRGRGAERTITVAPTQTVLEGALAGGVDMPFSCALGGCAACKCKVTSGHVEMDEPNCLTPEERADGWVLTCVGHATAPTTLEVP